MNSPPCAWPQPSPCRCAPIDDELRAVRRRAEKAAKRLGDGEASRLCREMAALARLASDDLRTTERGWDARGRAPEIRRLVGVISRMLPWKDGAFLDGIMKHITAALAHCRDCGVDVHKIGHYYMVSDDLWASGGLAKFDGQLCLGCLERRIGRPLRDDDFTAIAPRAWPERVRASRKPMQLTLEFG